ncbi:MAG TPA: YfhO family protein [Candidatus Hydrogenedentes bacterium]|nr:YfhO family protein [Candidatus Hydrogenedentota bacterium]HRT21578.1 YfhO family protein [Candidatus Hydrogenedentota bacterium]HRT66654.1 YfhO family protein [Candidatus Hydrogenedentota bacterium]
MTLRDSTPLREGLVHGLVLLLLLGAAFPGVFLRGEAAFPSDILYECRPWKAHAPQGFARSQNYLMSDPLSAFLPFYHVSEWALDAGEWPLWNPHELAGMPLLANCQSAVFYPPRLLFRVLSFPAAITVFVLLKLWLAGMAAYLCGRGLRLNAGAARLFSVAWMLSGYVFIWAYWPVSDAAAWFPIVFLGAEWALESRFRRAFWTTAIGGTLMFLAGHPESAFVLNVCLAIYMVFRLALARTGGILKPLGVWLGGWLVALIVCAPQLLPFLEYVVNSTPPGAGAHANFGPHPGLPARALASLWIPRFFGTTLERNYWGELDMNRFVMGYAGLPVWIVAALLLARPAMDRRMRARAIGLAAVAAICLLLAFEAPPFALLHALPGFNLVKRTYYVGFAVFALPLLAATVLQAWLEGRPRLRDLAWCMAAFAGIHLTTWLVYRFFAPLVRMLKMEDYVTGHWMVCAAAGLATMLVLAAAVRMKRPRAATALVALLVAADLLMAWRGINVTTPRSLWYPDTPLTRYLQALPGPCRVGLLEGMVPPGFMTPYGIQDINGYDGIYPERVIRLRQTLKTDAWNAIEPVYNVTHYLVNPEAWRYNAMAGPPIPLHESGRFERLDTIDGLEIYKNNRVLPRAFLTDKARIVPDTNDLFAILRDPGFDPRGEVLLPEPPDIALPEDRNGSTGTVRIVHYGTTRVEMETDAPGPRVLVLGDAYYPGWTATIDGGPVRILPAYYAFRAVSVPGGRHTVVFQYNPESFRLGMVLSVCAMLLAGIHVSRRLMV